MPNSNEITHAQGAHMLPEGRDATSEDFINLPDVSYRTDYDYQQYKVYAWQHAVLFSYDDVQYDIESAKRMCEGTMDYMQRVYGWAELPGFEILERQDWQMPAAAIELDDEDLTVRSMKLMLPPRGMTMSVIMHELAHMWAGYQELHGPKWLGTLMYLLVYGPENGYRGRIYMETLLDSARHYGLDYLFPHVLPPVIAGVKARVFAASCV
ncbi:hypothetical protein ACFL1S_09085 [Pseudomonadota bacterium]